MKIIDQELAGLVDRYLDWSVMIEAAKNDQENLSRQIIKRMPSNEMIVGDKNSYFAKIIKTKNGLVIKEICDGK
tara:strand:- start:604 stop:825 length:222 start_codon:yes stop_codon:yes gene_type:complete